MKFAVSNNIFFKNQELGKRIIFLPDVIAEIDPGGGVGLVIVFVAGDNCALLVLELFKWFQNMKM